MISRYFRMQKKKKNVNEKDKHKLVGKKMGIKNKKDLIQGTYEQLKKKHQNIFEIQEPIAFIITRCYREGKIKTKINEN